LWVTPGVRVTAPNGLYFYLAGEFSLSSNSDQDRYNWHEKGFTYSTGIQPAYGAQFTFGWNGFLATQDRDHDGVPDNIDKCPDDSGPAWNNGCPDPDSDKDGICDPWVSEKHQESKYAAVCKGVDKCPTKPEDVDGFQDDDGCPDLDNDHDGIPDTVDQCPNEPEDIDGFEDDDGCPDFDNDRDGVPDLIDKCPNVPGPASNDGCPDTTVPPKLLKKEPDFPTLQTLRGVTFQNKSAEMTFESFQWLDPIVTTMREFPGIEIEVRCYSDGLGKYAAAMQLTQMRAESVRQYIVNQGIDSTRVRAIGYGSASPIADNRTAAGRALNRRIEIVRLK
jgi:outer membrane protein OmpA-like peptidoglycan-associated protein